MTSFGWKKKSPDLKRSNIKTANGTLDCAFENNLKENAEKSEENASQVLNTYASCTTLKKRKHDQSLETVEEKVLRLKQEGIALAENEEYWQAIGKWDEALQIVEKNNELNETAKLHHEMKSQALIQLHEWEPAIHSAEQAIQIDSTWHPAHQTLGRAYLGIGGVLQAVKAFSRARHICPQDQEIKVQDLEWALSLLTHQKLMAAARELNQPDNKTLTDVK